MKVLISIDMEGVTGVTHPDDCLPGNPRWDYFRKIMTDEASAAVRGFVAGGATEIVINEAHNVMRNLLIDRLDGRAQLLSGRHKTFSMIEGIDSGVDAVAYLGYHTGAGKQGILSHTYLGNTYTGIWLNEVECSEGYMNTQMAASLRVPVVLVTGDDLTVADAKTYAPNARGVAVKKCVDRYTAICLTPEVTMPMIEEAAKKSIAKIIPVEPPQGPFTYRIQFDSTQPVIAACHIPGVKKTGDREVSFTLATMEEAFRCFGAVSTLVAAGIEPRFG
ncbi:MAG: peptide ABC transporter substrate-binding protein [Streptomycetaceae bacterium]|nr:MAG: peptide ABC transporter substrate-binding protein [Streptomycetaceae bacterium]